MSLLLFLVVQARSQRRTIILVLVESGAGRDLRVGQMRVCAHLIRPFLIVDIVC